MTAARIASLAILLAGTAACTPREEIAPSYAAPTYQPSATTARAPAERSYLDPGPSPGRGRPAYLQDSVGSAPRQTDGFGNDLRPSFW